MSQSRDTPSKRARQSAAVRSRRLEPPQLLEHGIRRYECATPNGTIEPDSNGFGWNSDQPELDGFDQQHRHSQLSYRAQPGVSRLHRQLRSDRYVGHDDLPGYRGGLRVVVLLPCPCERYEQHTGRILEHRKRDDTGYHSADGSNESDGHTCEPHID